MITKTGSDLLRSAHNLEVAHKPITKTGASMLGRAHEFLKKPRSIQYGKVKQIDRVRGKLKQQREELWKKIRREGLMDDFAQDKHSPRLAQLYKRKISLPKAKSVEVGNAYKWLGAAGLGAAGAGYKKLTDGDFQSIAWGKKEQEKKSMITKTARVFGKNLDRTLDDGTRHIKDFPTQISAARSISREKAREHRTPWRTALLSGGIPGTAIGLLGGLAARNPRRSLLHRFGNVATSSAVGGLMGAGIGAAAKTVDDDAISTAKALNSAPDEVIAQHLSTLQAQRTLAQEAEKRRYMGAYMERQRPAVAAGDTYA